VPFPRKSFLSLAFVLASTAGTALAVELADVRPARAEAALLVDVESGKVLEGENATYPWYPASVTKLMTSYVTFTAIREHRLAFDTLVSVSANAVAQQPSKMGFKLGSQLTVDNALKMMLVHSANDMAVVLAEGVSGSIDKFADEMNASAKRLGMTQTHYVNPNGLPDDGQVTSARDLAILARALIREFPEYDSYWHISSIRFGKKIYNNTNHMVDNYPGTDGMKTGFICASGYNIVATASRGGKRLIAVVLGAPSGTARSNKAAHMFERGFAFNPNPLNWLASSRGTVEDLVPIAAQPPNLRDDICGRNPRRAPNDEDEATEVASAASGGFFLSSVSNTPPKALTSGVAPIEVYLGPKRVPGAPPTAIAKRKKSDETEIAAKPPAKNKTTTKSDEASTETTATTATATKPPAKKKVAKPDGAPTDTTAVAVKPPKTKSAQKSDGTSAAKKPEASSTETANGLKPWPGEAEASAPASEKKTKSAAVKPKPKSEAAVHDGNGETR
jgi:D-alanyl-D-alanine carboxypeptidase